ncbi:hypothetical protein RUM43_007219, partial [Polyplax serrata]
SCQADAGLSYSSTPLLVIRDRPDLCTAHNGTHFDDPETHFYDRTISVKSLKHIQKV